MESFAFIVTPINIKQLKSLWTSLRVVPNPIIKLFSNTLPRFRVLRVKGIRSKQGKRIDGFFIVSPLTPEQLSRAGADFVLDRIISAGHIAGKLGAKIVGLDCLAASIADKEYDMIIKKLKIPFTSGNAFTAWSIFEGIYRLAKAKKIDLKQSHLAIIGAGSVALRLCVRKLSDYFGKLSLVEKQAEKLENLKQSIIANSGIGVSISNDPYEAIKDADIVIKAECLEDPRLDFNMHHLKPKAVLCNLHSFYRPFKRHGLPGGVMFIDLGLIKLPFQDRLGLNLGLPRGIILASLAETMLLALEEKFINYSLGEDINLDKLEEIADMAARHGFEVWVPEAPVI